MVQASQKPGTLDPMEIALEEARAAFRCGDVPVGAVIMRGNELIARAHNTREAEHTAIGHAEINAIAEACRVLNSKWLADCTLYVTLEPCPMCAGAILQARIPLVVCGASDPVAGAMGSVWALHRQSVEQGTRITLGDREAESREMLRSFFQSARLDS